jgi:hypothetical protein
MIKKLTGRKKKMRKLSVIVATILLGVFFAVQSAKAADLSALPQDLQDLITNLLETRFPPELQSINLAPAEPAAGQPTKITINIFNDSSVTSDTLTGLVVYYMVNFDGKWNVLEVTSDDNKTWTGEFPAFQKDDEIVYSIRATDSSTNVFTTVPCKIGELEADYLKSANRMNDCTKAGADLTACDDPTPRDCFMSMSQTDETIKKDAGKNIPKESNFVDYRVGYDDANVYVDLTVEGKTVSEGTMNPIDIRGYVGLILNPDKIGKIKDLDGLLAAGGGAVMLYAPLADMAGGMIKSCALIYMKSNSMVQDDKGLACARKQNHLLFSIKKASLPSAVGANTSGIYHFFIASLAITNFPSPVEGKPFDYSHITSVQLTDQPYFQVK